MHRGTGEEGHIEPSFFSFPETWCSLGAAPVSGLTLQKGVMFEAGSDTPYHPPGTP